MTNSVSGKLVYNLIQGTVEKVDWWRLICNNKASPLFGFFLTYDYQTHGHSYRAYVNSYKTQTIVTKKEKYFKCP